MDIRALEVALEDVAALVSWWKANLDVPGFPRQGGAFVSSKTIIALYEAAEAQLKSLQEGK